MLKHACTELPGIRNVHQNWDGCRNGWFCIGAESFRSVRLSGGGRTGQTFCMSRSGLVKVFARMDRIGQTSSRSKRDWSNFLQDQAGLVRLPAGAGGIGYISVGVGGIIGIVIGTLVRSKWDWSNFQQEWVELVKLFAEEGRICRMFGRSRHNWLDIRLDHSGLIILLARVCRISQSFCWRSYDWSFLVPEH